MQFDRGPGHQNLHRHRSRVRLLLLPTVVPKNLIVIRIVEVSSFRC